MSGNGEIPHIHEKRHSRSRDFNDGNLNSLFVAGIPEDFTAGFMPLFLRKRQEDEIATRSRFWWILIIRFLRALLLLLALLLIAVLLSLLPALLLLL